MTPPTFPMAVPLPVSRQDWTREEQVELDRLRRAFVGGHFTVECDHTDERDPWCVVYDTSADRELLHIARIGRRYVLVWPERDMKTSAASLASLVGAVIGMTGAAEPTLRSGLTRSR